MVFRKKKKGLGLSDLDFDKEEIIDFKEFEEMEEEVKKNKDLEPDELEKNFIFHISNGCPVCGGDVKGNDYYRYFCENCNVLFDKKDIIEKEFGKSITETGPVKKTILTDDEREELDKKRKELKDRIFKTFTEEEKKELVEEAEETKEEPEEEVLETQEPKGVEEIVDYMPEEEGEEPEPTPEPEPEYELEEEGKIIASSQSTKIHAGNCHFVKRIHPENRIYFDSTEQGEEEGYEMCVCLRRIKALQR
jgi:hypothetical protein